MSTGFEIELGILGVPNAPGSEPFERARRALETAYQRGQRDAQPAVDRMRSTLLAMSGAVHQMAQQSAATALASLPLAGDRVEASFREVIARLDLVRRLVDSMVMESR
jgi:hypothetical protein